MRILPAFSLLAFAATPILAQDAAKQDEKPAAEKKVCRRTKAIGSNMTKSVCHTAAEWKAMSTNDADDTDRYLRRPQGYGPGSGPGGIDG